eukprot:875937-Prymnesium_polylepis.1
MTGCTAAPAARTSRRLSGQLRRAPTGVRPTCGTSLSCSRAIIVLVCSRLRRHDDRLHCGDRRRYLPAAERAVEASPDR